MLFIIHGIDDTIKNAIIDNISDKEQTEQTEEKETSMPKVITNYIEKTTQDAKNAGIELVAENISITLVKLMVAIALFIIVRIILIFVKLFTNIVEKLPVIKQFNKIGGVIYGIIEGLFIIFLILAIISVISPMINTSSLLQAINDSYIGSILYHNNILLNLIF